MARLKETVNTFVQYLSPNFQAIYYFNNQFDVNHPIKAEFTLRNYHVNAYLDMSNDLFKYNIQENRTKKILALILVDCLIWIFYLLSKGNVEYQLSIGDISPLLGGNETYSKLSALISCCRINLV